MKTYRISLWRLCLLAFATLLCVAFLAAVSPISDEAAAWRRVVDCAVQP